jgi:hypothetical protein
MIASAGNLYQISTTTGGTASVLAIGPGDIVAAPIVDVTNDTTFVVTPDDGAAAALIQVRSSTLHKISTAEIGLGSHGGDTAVTLYAPAFSNGYFTALTDGIVTLCGTGGSDTTPYQYVFGFHRRIVLHEEAAFSQQLVDDPNATCTEWTEFYNPSIAGGRLQTC